MVFVLVSRSRRVVPDELVTCDYNSGIHCLHFNFHYPSGIPLRIK